MSTVTRLITAEELFRMPDNGGRCELVDGEIVQMEPPGAMHGFVSMSLQRLLLNYVEARGLGVGFASETGFIVSRNPDSVLAPDGAFVRQERIDALGIPAEYFPEAPALVIEVRSKEDTSAKLAAKMERWLAAGVELGWAVDPKARSVTVYHPTRERRTLTGDEVLSGEQVVPGFECRVADLFPKT